jgi:hypothetical protein
MNRRIPFQRQRQLQQALPVAGALLVLALVALIVLDRTGLLTRGAWVKAGEVRVESGALLLSDPSYLPDELADLTVRVEGVPDGSWPVEAWRQTMREGGERAMRMRVVWRSGAISARRQLGQVGVDSALIAAIDPARVARDWVEVGPLRTGTIGGLDKEKLADLLRAWGTAVGQGDAWSMPLIEPVSVADEARIKKLIEDNHLRALLSITTGNTLDRLFERLGNGDWAELPQADGTPGLVVACVTGYGDGSYPVYGLYQGNTLVGVEVDFG